MPRSSHIYHLYKNGKRLLSGTVKQEVLYSLYKDGFTSKEYTLTSSGDNSFGEHEVLGWRNKPSIGDRVGFIDSTVEKIIYVDGLNPSGSWSVKTELTGKTMIKWCSENKFWESLCGLTPTEVKAALRRI